MEMQRARNDHQTLMERICEHCDIQEGLINSKQVLILLQRLHPEIEIDEKELQRTISEYDPSGSGQFDFDSVTKIIFNIMMKQSTESNPYNFFWNEYKRDQTRISLQDFIIFNNL